MSILHAARFLRLIRHTRFITILPKRGLCLAVPAWKATSLVLWFRRMGTFGEMLPGLHTRSTFVFLRLQGVKDFRELLGTSTDFQILPFTVGFLNSVLGDLRRSHRVTLEISLSGSCDLRRPHPCDSWDLTVWFLAI